MAKTKIIKRHIGNGVENKTHEKGTNESNEMETGDIVQTETRQQRQNVNGDLDRARRDKNLIKVSPIATSNFTDMVRDMRTIRVQSGDVLAIKKTENGRDAIITVGENCDVGKLLEEIGNKETVQSATVMRIKRRVMLKYMEITVTEKEILEAVRLYDKSGTEESKVIFLTKGAKDTLTACVEVSRELASTLLSEGRI